MFEPQSLPKSLQSEQLSELGGELMAEESSNSRGKKESAAVPLSILPRQDDDVEDPIKSPPHSPNNSSTRKVYKFIC